MAMKTRSAIGAALLLLASQSLRGQTSALLGTVMRDTLGHAVGGGAEVRIPQLNGGTTTNYLGEFRLTRIPPGTYLVTIRSVGFAPFADSITFVANQAVTREFVMTAIVTKLDTVQTRAAAARKYLSPALTGFEERRLSGMGGYFIADSVMRASESRLLPNVLSRIPGIQLITRHDSIFLASSRSVNDGGLVFLGGRTPCYITLYMDGVLRWQGPASATGAPMVDYNQILVSDLAGAEFYASGTALPIQYSTHNNCGVLLLWTRER